MTRADLAGALAAAALLIGGLAGCSGDTETASTAPPTSSAPSPRSYVALGDSFTAAPFVPGTDLADGCLRSEGNYPSLVAAELGLDLRDVSCSGAATADLRDRQQMSYPDFQSSVPPQLEAVRPGTDLVTVGIGGNDENLFQTLVQQCTAVAGQAGAPCTELLTDSYNQPANVLDVVGSRVTRLLEAVERRAPEARVVLIGYPRLVDGTRSCPSMPIAEDDLPLVADLEAQLNRALARAARAAGAEYVDMYSVSQGHEICSDDPWVNGRTTDQRRALAFHPFPEGQRAVADELVALLTSP